MAAIFLLGVYITPAISKNILVQASFRKKKNSSENCNFPR